jgi:Ribbon-helix-helix protein, copG family
MKRVNIYLTDKQIERLHQRAEKEGISMAELVRRALDTFLAWDDPTYIPSLRPQLRNAHSSPG